MKWHQENWLLGATTVIRIPVLSISYGLRGVNVYTTHHTFLLPKMALCADKFEEDYMVTPQKWSTIGKTLGLEKRQHFTTSQAVTMDT